MTTHDILFDAIVFPSDDRPPYIALVMTSPLGRSVGLGLGEPTRCGRIPHPEVYMDYVICNSGCRAWSFQVIDALDSMLQKLPSPYILFYPASSRDGMPFPVNKYTCAIQHNKIDKHVWRGDLVVLKYEQEYRAMRDASMADFPIIKNYLSTH